MKYFIAGGICAAVSHGIMTPIDVVKTRMQAYPEIYTKGIIAAVLDIVREKGVLFLLKGFTPTIIGYGIEGALTFGTYETCKNHFRKLTQSVFGNILFASFVAGIVASTVLCPIEGVRIKMVGDDAYAEENIVAAFAHLFVENGFLSVFKIFPAMLCKHLPYTMSKQVSFDLISRTLHSLANKSQESRSTKWLISIGSAFLTSIIACILSQPGDMVLTASFNEKKNQSIFFIADKIYKQYGARGFFVGLKARIALLAAIITLQLVVYDMVKLALNLPYTGSD